MEMKEKKLYESPQFTVATFMTEQGFTGSNRGMRLTTTWIATGIIDPWNNPTPSGGNSISSGWTDNGGSAWEN